MRSFQLARSLSAPPVAVDEKIGEPLKDPGRREPWMCFSDQESNYCASNTIIEVEMVKPAIVARVALLLRIEPSHGFLLTACKRGNGG